MGSGDETGIARKRPTVCQNCRIRHVKCDWIGDACRQCLDLGIECAASAPFKFRYDAKQKDFAAQNAVWLKLRGPWTYVDEAPGLRSFYGHSNGDGKADGLNAAVVSPSVFSGSNRRHTSAVLFSQSTPSNDFTSPNESSNLSPGQRAAAHHPFTETEAALIRNFIERMAQWADAENPLRISEIELPVRALEEPVLRHAICAFSARHLFRGQPQGETEALHHQQNCLQLLIPAIANTKGINDVTLMAVAILRQNEEMDEQDNRFHLEGVSKTLALVPEYATVGGLGEAAAWLCLREEMYVSLTRQSPITIDLSRFQESVSILRGDDASWASKMILHLAFLLKRAFGESASSDDLTKSEGEIAQWHTSKPASYEPTLYRPRSARAHRALPEIWMLSKHHAIGLQYFHIAQIVLNVMRQRVQTKPYDVLSDNRARERSIRHHLLTVVGIAASNSNAENTWFTARHCLSVYGGCLRKREDQDAAVDFLARMSERTGWRIDSLLHSLRSQWAEDSSDSG